MQILQRVFGLEARGTMSGTEIRAGAATFLTMACILVVNPQILGQAGLPAADVAVATALAAAIATLVMGLWANYPFALAPGMGPNGKVGEVSRAAGQRVCLTARAFRHPPVEHALQVEQQKSSRRAA